MSKLNPGWYILLYHNISWEETPYTRPIGGVCPPFLFEEHLKYLSQEGHLVSVKQGIELWKENNIKEPLFSFWFDDEFKDVRNEAVPLLKKYQTTGAMSVCSRFVKRQELMWRCVVSYLGYVDAKKILRSRLKVLGYRPSDTIKDFTLNHFSDEILLLLNQVWFDYVTPDERDQGMSLFDDTEGLRELVQENWLLTNHSSAHYPIGEDSYIDHMVNQFKECDVFLKEDLDYHTPFYVLPFDREQHCSDQLIPMFQRHFEKDDVLVLVRDQVNSCFQKDPVLYRFNVPFVSGPELIKYLA